MNEFTQSEDGRYLSDNKLVEVYQCSDGTWRVAFYHYVDKERNLTRDEAFRVAGERLAEIRPGKGLTI